MSQCADTGYRPDDVAAVVDDTSTPIPDSVTPAAQAPARPPVGDETGAAVADTAGAFQSGPATVAGAGVEDRRDDNGTAADESTPEIAPIWNRILGQVDLCPPNSTQQPGPREKRLNELTVFLAAQPFRRQQRHHPRRLWRSGFGQDRHPTGVHVARPPGHRASRWAKGVAAHE